MPSLRNPKFVSPIAAKVTARRAAIETYLTNNAGLAEISFDKIRADNPGIAADLTDAVLNEVCRVIGAEIVS